MEIKYSKKKQELRQDPIMDFLTDAKEFIEKNSNTIVICAVAACVVLIGGWAYRYFQKSGEEKAQDAFARGGQEITGPSIRLAETIAQGWGHLQYGMRELSNVGGASEVEAYCWDLESNVRKSIQFTVSHIRNTKKGSYALTDSRDIYENVANNGARRVRACILAIVPGDVVEAAEKACESTLKAKVDLSPERILKLLEAFAAFGVNKEAVEKKIQRRMDSILPAQVVSLGRIYNSLRDGMSKPQEWFDIAPDAAPVPEDLASLQTAAAATAANRKAGTA